MKKWLGHPAPVLWLEATATTVIDAPVLSHALDEATWMSDLAVVMDVRETGLVETSK